MQIKHEFKKTTQRRNRIIENSEFANSKNKQQTTKKKKRTNKILTNKQTCCSVTRYQDILYFKFLCKY